MIRLSVLYNLPSHADEEEYLKWRLGEHQQANSSLPGAMGNDFARVLEAWPQGTQVPFRFVTNIDWPNRESFEAGFFSPPVQRDLEASMKRIIQPVFLITEVLVSERKEEK